MTDMYFAIVTLQWRTEDETHTHSGSFHGTIEAGVDPNTLYHRLFRKGRQLWNTPAQENVSVIFYHVERYTVPEAAPPVTRSADDIEPGTDVAGDAA